MGILGFTAEDVELGLGLTQPQENVAYFDNCPFVEDEELTIIAHSSDGFWSGKPEQIGGLDAKNFAEKLAQKYGDKKSALKHLYLLACEAGLWIDSKPPLAQAFANELYRKGFTNVIVHAITPPKELTADGGQVVSLVSLKAAEPKTVIESYVYANDKHRKLDGTLSTTKPSELKAKLSDDDYQLARTLHFKPRVTVVSFLDRASYRGRLQGADYTYKATVASRQYTSLHSDLLCELQGQIQLLQAQQKVKKSRNREQSISDLQQLYTTLSEVKGKDSESISSALTLSLRQTREALRTSGYHRFRNNDNHHALAAIDFLLEKLGKPVEKKGMFEQFFQETSTEQYQTLHDECQSLITEIKAIKDELPQNLIVQIDDINRVSLETIDEETATEKLPKLEALKESLIRHLQRLQSIQARDTLHEIFKRLQSLTRYARKHQQVNAKLAAFTKRREEMRASHEHLQAAQQLLTDITDYENRELSDYKWQQMQQQFNELRQAILNHESVILGREIKPGARGRITNTAGDSKLLTTLNACNVVFGPSLEDKAQSSHKSKSDIITDGQKHLDSLQSIVDGLETTSYKAVEKLIQKFDRKSKSFFSINCKKKANLIRAAVQNVDAKHRGHLLQDEAVRNAINYHRISFFCCAQGPTKSYQELDQKFHQEMTARR